MSVILIITIYLIGCVLSYGRFFATFYEIDENYIKWLPPSCNRNIILMLSLLSWVSFMVGVIWFFIENEKYFLKWNNKDLWEQYNNRYKL